MTLSQLARLLGKASVYTRDVNAAARGRLGQRLANRIMGRDRVAGDAEVVAIMPASTPALERFLIKVEKTPGCWLWTGSILSNGYGWFSLEQRGTSAHRAAWRLLRGPIPAGLTIDHLCRNKACVNPDHLEPVTMRENIRRSGIAWVLNTGHCKHGHAMTSENTYQRSDGYANCRACCRVAGARYKARKRQAKR